MTAKAPIYEAYGIEIPVTAADIAAIKSDANALKSKIENSENLADSILHGQGTWVGLVGERLIAKYLGFKHQSLDSKSYHFDIRSQFREHWTGEVKTKLRTVRCRAHYLASVAAANCTQRCLWYFFGSLMAKEDRPDDIVFQWWGGLRSDTFKRIAFKGREGELDPTSDVGRDWKFRANCYNVPLFALKPPPMKGYGEHRQIKCAAYGSELRIEGLEMLRQYADKYDERRKKFPPPAWKGD